MKISNSMTKSLNHSIYTLIKRHQHTMSFSQRHSITSRLTTTGKDLHRLGFGLRHIQRIKQKHINALVTHWQGKSLSVGAIKNRLADLRLACQDAGRGTVMKNTAADGVGKRPYVATHDRAIVVDDFSAIADQHLQHSLALQREFGLRREECLKLIPSLADKGDVLWLKGSWTKGNVERVVPIVTPSQRRALERAKAFVGEGKSLIPEHATYIEQRHRYQHETRKIGLTKLHGLRHAYAQRRYKMLTGWEAPIKGGKSRHLLTEKERAIDRKARYTISRELGHSRISITRVYLG